MDRVTPTSNQSKMRKGKLSQLKKEQAARRVEHFKEVPNRPQPNEAANPEPSDGLNINTDPPSRAEVETVIKPLKNGNAPGIDSLQAEVLKADTTTASLGLSDLFTNIYNHEVISKDWSMGLIYKIRKKRASLIVTTVEA